MPFFTLKVTHSNTNPVSDLHLSLKHTLQINWNALPHWSHIRMPNTMSLIMWCTSGIHPRPWTLHSTTNYIATSPKYTWWAISFCYLFLNVINRIKSSEFAELLTSSNFPLFHLNPSQVSVRLPERSSIAFRTISIRMSYFFVHLCILTKIH